MVRVRWSCLLLCAACFGESEDPNGSSSAGSSGHETDATSMTSVSATMLNTADAVTTDETVSDSMTTGPDTSGTAGDCGPLVEVPSFGEPWSGPIVLMPGQPMMPPPSCPDGFMPVDDPVVSTDSPGTCACHCEDPPHVSCGVSFGIGDTSCGASTDADGACTRLETNPTWVQVQVNPQADCSPAAALDPGPDAAPAMLCGPTSGDGASCIAVPGGATGPCVFAMDGPGCPPEFPEAHDSQIGQCGACTCSDMGDYCDALMMASFSSNDCSTGPLLSLDGFCRQVPGMSSQQQHSVSVAEGMPMQCTAELVSMTPVSICCVP